MGVSILIVVHAKAVLGSAGVLGGLLGKCVHMLLDFLLSGLDVPEWLESFLLCELETVFLEQCGIGDNLLLGGDFVDEWTFAKGFSRRTDSVKKVGINPFLVY